LFVVSNPPGGSIQVAYSWHLVGGGITTPKTVAMKAGRYTDTYSQYLNGTNTGDVYVSWTAAGSSGESPPIRVSMTCIT